MARQHGIIQITTLHPPMPGLDVLVVHQDDRREPDFERVIASGVLDAGGAWRHEYSGIDEDTLIVLVLRNAVTDLVTCRVPLRALNPMECFMTSPPELTQDELHKRFMNAHRKMKLGGVASPEPDDVARLASKY